MIRTSTCNIASPGEALTHPGTASIGEALTHPDFTICNVMYFEKRDVRPIIRIRVLPSPIVHTPRFFG